jgi:hypothetical protein
VTALPQDLNVELSHAKWGEDGLLYIELPYLWNASPLAGARPVSAYRSALAKLTEKEIGELSKKIGALTLDDQLEIRSHIERGTKLDIRNPETDCERRVAPILLELPRKLQEIIGPEIYDWLTNDDRLDLLDRYTLRALDQAWAQQLRLEIVGGERINVTVRTQTGDVTDFPDRLSLRDFLQAEMIRQERNTKDDWDGS